MEISRIAIEIEEIVKFIDWEMENVWKIKKSREPKLYKEKTISLPLFMNEICSKRSFFSQDGN